MDPDPYRDQKGKKPQQQGHQQPRGPEPAPPNPYQCELQGADDTWERVLCAMERLEYLVDQRHPQRSAMRLDRHRDRDQIQVTVFHAQAEVDLQIKCFWYAVSTVRGDQITHHFLTDFLCWLGGREQMQLPLTLVDKYAIGTINCILGEQMERLGLPELPPEEVARYSPSQQPESRYQQNQQGYVDPNRNLSSYPQSYGENIQSSQPNQQPNSQKLIPKWMQDAIGWMTQGMDEIEKLYDHFRRNPDEKAILHHHQRGSLNQGLERLAKIAEASQQTSWFNRFVQEWQSRFQNQR